MSKIKNIAIAQLRKKKIGELHKLLKETIATLVKDRMALNTKKTKNTNILSPNRKLVAHIKTVLYEKRLLQQVAPGVLKK